MEGLGLVELLAVLSALLVGPDILLSSPGSRVPQLVVEYVPRLII